MAINSTPLGSKNNIIRQYWNIQALRFVAALMVVLVHSTFYVNERLTSGFPIYNEGVRGVRLFFVISGMVMILSSERLNKTSKGWAIFAAKRAVRIVPMYWAILFVKVLALIATNLAIHTKLDPFYTLKSFFFIPAIGLDGSITPLHGVGWTLNFEMFFYLLFTFALCARLRPVTFIAPVLVVLALLTPHRSNDWPVALQFYANGAVLDFLAGMLIARWCQRGLSLNPILSAVIISVGLMGLFAPITWPSMPELTNSLLITLLSALVVIGAAALEPIMGKAVPRWIIFMGSASYALYLAHPLVAPASPWLFARFGIALPWLAAALSVLIALVGGALLYVLVEAPITAYLSRWLNRRIFKAWKPTSLGDPTFPSKCHGDDQVAHT